MDAQYFIDKFTAIPVERWGQFHYGEGDVHCALGHCGVRNYTPSLAATPESRALVDIFAESGNLSVTLTNDHMTDQFPQPNPRARILAALEYLKTL